MSNLVVTVSTEVDDAEFHKSLEGMEPLAFSVLPGGYYLYKLLQSLYSGQPLRIVETGCLRDTRPSAAFSDGWSTYYLARFAKETGSLFTSIELFKAGIETCWNFLFTYGLDRQVNFVCEDSIHVLNNFPNLAPADFYLLDSCDGLEHGLAEFKAASAHKPKMIVMDDIATKAAMAIQYAKDSGSWNLEYVDRYVVFRPHLRTPA